MKRLIAMLLCAALALSLCACGKVASEENAPAAVTADDPTIKAFRAVLAGADTFTSAFSGASVRVSNGTISNSTNFPTILNKLALLDLDSDGTRELILKMDDANTPDTFGYWILRYQEENVLGYDLLYKTFDGLKEDGTFSRDEGGFGGIGTMCFTESGWEMDYQIMAKRTLDANFSLISQEYFMGGQSVTVEEASKIYSQQLAKPDARWYCFSIANFERAVQGSVSDLNEILAGNGVFYSQHHQALVTPENFCRIYSAQIEKTVSFSRAAVLDLDGDGAMDAVLELTSGGENCGAVVLHEQNGRVEGCILSDRAVTDLKTDGSYRLADGTITKNCVSRMTFDPSYWSDEVLLREEHGIDGTTYFVAPSQATKAEFEKALAAQNAKEDARWVDFPCTEPVEK